MDIPAHVHLYILSMLGNAQSETKHGNMKAVKSLLQMLLLAGIAYKMTIQPDLIGVHPDNRGGYGINPHDVAALIYAILELGWDDASASGLCVEVPAHASSKVSDFNQRLVDCAAGLLPAFAAGSIKFASLWGSHTNAALRCLYHGVKHACDELTRDGCLSIDKLKAVDAPFADAALNGLKNWIVLPWELLVKYPGLGSLISAAGNSVQGVSVAAHDFELMRQISMTCQQLMSVTPNVRLQFNQVRNIVLKTQPKNKESLPFLYNMVTNHGGGLPLLAYFTRAEAFVKASVSSLASVPRAFAEALVLEYKGHKQCSLFRWAALKAFYTSNWITASDCRRFASKDTLPKVKDADDLMDKLHVLSADLITRPDVEHIMSTHEMLMVKFVLDKKTDSNFKSLNSIMATCIEQIKDTANVKLTSDYDEFISTNPGVKAKAKPKAKAAASSSDDAVGFAAAGSDRTIVIMQKLGFSIGDVVYHKENKTVRLKIKTL